MDLDNIGKLRKTHYASEIVPAMDGKDAVLMGWAREIRLLGNLVFVVLSDRSGDCQVTFLSKTKKAFEIAQELNREDVIAIKGKIKKSTKTNRGVEVLAEEIFVLNKSKTPLPLEITEKTPSDLDTRLNSRVLDLRKPKSVAVFKIRNQILESAREYFTEQGLMEIESPKIIASASEGGAALFPVSYYDKEAFLRQSPQLYKELMTACFERVFEIGHVFRAEPSDTIHHLSEVTQMDIELGFATEEDTWEILEGVINRIYSDVSEKQMEALEMLGQKIKIPKIPFKRITYDEAVEFLDKQGVKIKWGDDTSREHEKMITDHFKGPVIVHDYPMDMKPFYIAHREDNPKISYGFDLFMEGVEISSGGRRVHEAAQYIENLKAKDLNPAEFADIIKFYEYGMPPHAGWAIGVDRLTMLIAGVENVRETVLFPRDLKRLTP
ncbi:MAG: aspartate--tRNA(Asn) ligase [archaeon]|mgnify:CR=1 FL=1|jgi:aspartyl-tRNA synthetase|nr:aspartate--tRNA(Asn) ligase [Euryarchaeota archaeon]MDP6704008.1 aspartate--tRNA(Asn) ligase [archaeon]MDP7260542.1 aspartate--tRNA(Asn) ligase [archaeon]|tara:strand:- start:16101 stop:17414 length:1314 start_codon:yes stop_codon:yes gene_type:complete